MLKTVNNESNARSNARVPFAQSSRSLWESVQPQQYFTACDDCFLHYRAAKAISSSSDIQGSPFALLSSIRIKRLNFDLLKLFISLFPRH